MNKHKKKREHNGFIETQRERQSDLLIINEEYYSYSLNIASIVYEVKVESLLKSMDSL
jgi:hypothetical protein